MASAWTHANRAEIEHHVLGAGAVLLRGFDAPAGAGELETLMAGLYQSLVTEHERSSPGHRVSGNVYTSTDHPADQEIFLHNEMSYSHTWPMRIGFYCRVQPETGGETPIADTSVEPGLELCLGNGSDEPVTNRPDELAVFPGAVFATLTAGRVSAMYHQVRNHHLAQRMSIMYFVNPELDSPLPSWSDGEDPAGTDIRPRVRNRPSAYGLPDPAAG
ncbi:MAG: TauD/TfdA family dioxygenase [Streptosporangiaceae bacterium]